MAASALALDPERLLWVPGKKTIFIPKPHALRFHPKVFVMEWPLWRRIEYVTVAEFRAQYPDTTLPPAPAD